MSAMWRSDVNHLCTCWPSLGIAKRSPLAAAQPRTGAFLRGALYTGALRGYLRPASLTNPRPPRFRGSLQRLAGLELPHCHVELFHLFLSKAERGWGAPGWDEDASAAA